MDEVGEGGVWRRMDKVGERCVAEKDKAGEGGVWRRMDDAGEGIRPEKAGCGGDGIRPEKKVCGGEGIRAEKGVVWRRMDKVGDGDKGGEGIKAEKLSARIPGLWPPRLRPRRPPLLPPSPPPRPPLPSASAGRRARGPRAGAPARAPQPGPRSRVVAVFVVSICLRERRGGPGGEAWRPPAPAARPPGRWGSCPGSRCAGRPPASTSPACRRTSRRGPAPRRPPGAAPAQLYHLHHGLFACTQARLQKWQSCVSNLPEAGGVGQLGRAGAHGSTIRAVGVSRAVLSCRQRRAATHCQAGPSLRGPQATSRAPSRADAQATPLPPLLVPLHCFGRKHAAGRRPGAALRAATASVEEV